MKRLPMVLCCFFALSAATFVGILLLAPHRSQAQGLAGTPEQQAAQAEIEKTYPSMQINDQYLHLSIPGNTMGQTVGVAVNSKGHLFVYSRSNPQGVARGGKAAMLWEFDQNYKFVKEWGSGERRRQSTTYSQTWKSCTLLPRINRPGMSIRPAGWEHSTAKRM